MTTLLPALQFILVAALLLVGIPAIAIAQSGPITQHEGQSQQTPAVDKAKSGPLAVETASDLGLRRVSGETETILSLRVHYPMTGGPYPLVLFSHGFGADQSSFAPISQHWASHGYVVIHPTHADSIDRGGVGNNDGGAPEASSNRVRRARLLGSLNDPGKISIRVGDLVMILDSLDELPKLEPGLAGKINPKAVAVAGHSLGAYTAMLLGGVTADIGRDKARSFCDERVQCVLAISGQGTGQQGLTATSWEALQRPMMVITGTRDRGAGGQGVEWKKEPFVFSPPGDKYLVVIDGANHVSFGGGLGPRGNSITEIVKRCTTHTLDAYLKEDESSKQYLKSNSLADESAGKCLIEHK